MCHSLIDCLTPVAVRFVNKRLEKQLLRMEEKYMVKAKQKPKRGFGRPAAGKPPRQAVTVSTKLETDDLFPLTFYKKFRVNQPPQSEFGCLA